MPCIFFDLLLSIIARIPIEVKKDKQLIHRNITHPCMEENEKVNLKT